MFPGPHATIVRNDAREPIGWDNHYYDDEPREYDEDDERRYQAMKCPACGQHPEDCERDENDNCVAWEPEDDDTRGSYREYGRGLE